MKKIPLLFALLIMLSGSANAQWQTIYYGDIPQLNAVSFIDIDHGVAAGVTLDIADHGIILRTSDRGATWDTVLTTLFEFQDIEYTDTSTIIAVSNGLIARSVDDGTTWDTLTSTSRLNSVCFPSENVGYAGGIGGMIYKTTDEGISWTPISTGYPINITSVFFINDTVGFATAFSSILKTIDGGASWTSQNPTWTCGKVCFPSDSIGYIYSPYKTDTMQIYKTTNMGASWSLVSTVCSDQFLCNIHFINDYVGYVCGFFQIQKTIDGGLSWTAQGTTGPGFPNFMDWVADMYFFNEDTGYAVGYGVFYRMPADSNTVSFGKYSTDNNVGIFPNPTSGTLTLQLPSQFGTIKSLEVYNTLGQLQETPELRTAIDISTYKSGLYFFVVTNDKGERLSARVVKE